MQRFWEILIKVLTYRVHVRLWRFSVFPGPRVPLWGVLLLVLVSLALVGYRNAKMSRNNAAVLEQARVAELSTHSGLTTVGTVTDFWHVKKGAINHFVIHMRWHDRDGDSRNGVAKFASTILDVDDVHMGVGQRVTLYLHARSPEVAYVTLLGNGQPLTIWWREP